ncbi:MAG TPA: hypothetical protein VLB67_16005 [Acidimicrobiia bacterium]|nr:hypothetical protein [Acidimicrobiia bacterium]
METADDTRRLEFACPVTLVVEEMAALLNAEITDHPIYDGIELQWFDDATHGTGMLAFLSRRDDRRVDYYVEPGLTLDRTGYEIGGGTGVWVEAAFGAARLEVGSEGVVADVRFVDVDGRSIEVLVDDREAGPRRGGSLLAPVGSSVDRPASLLLAFLHGFDLIRRGPDVPRIVIDGSDVRTGRLPFGVLHRRHLIKAAGPVTVARLCPTGVPARDDLEIEETGDVVVAVRARQGRSEAEVRLQPGFPHVQSPDGSVEGAWTVSIDGMPITGGEWSAIRHDDRIDVSLDVTRPWKPAAGQSPLMRIVTRVAPVFRRWPTTYRWDATIELGDAGSMIDGRWSRIGGDDSYRRLTRS